MVSKISKTFRPIEQLLAMLVDQRFIVCGDAAHQIIASLTMVARAGLITIFSALISRILDIFLVLVMF